MTNMAGTHRNGCWFRPFDYNPMAGTTIPDPTYFGLIGHSLYMQKERALSEITGSLEAFGFATGKIDFPASCEAKELAARDFPGFDGESVHFPDTLRFAATDLNVEFKYRDDDSKAYERITAFRDWMSGRSDAGTKMMIYSPWTNAGRRGVYMKSISEPEYRRDDLGTYLSVTVTFRLTDPVTEVVSSTVLAESGIRYELKIKDE